MPILVRSTLTWHPKWGATCYFFFNIFLAPKLLQIQNLGGRFVVFFLGGQNRNFVKVRELKLQLSLFIIQRISKDFILLSFALLFFSFNTHDISKPKLAIQTSIFACHNFFISTFWMECSMKCGEWIKCSAIELLDIKTCLEQQLSNQSNNNVPLV